LLDRRDLFGRARILVGWIGGRYEAKEFFAMRNPGTLGHKAMLAGDPFLDLLVRGALTRGLLLGRSTLPAPVPSILIATLHFASRPD